MLEKPPTELPTWPGEKKRGKMIKAWEKKETKKRMKEKNKQTNDSKLILEGCSEWLRDGYSLAQIVSSSLLQWDFLPISSEKQKSEYIGTFSLQQNLN